MHEHMNMRKCMHAHTNIEMQYEHSHAAEACLQACDLRRWQGVTPRGSGKQDRRLLTVLLQLTRAGRALLPGN